jgi:hypothetical protein
LEYRETTQVADRHIPLDMFARLFPGLGRDDSRGEERNVEEFRREFEAQADSLAHRRQVGCHERQSGGRVVAKRSPDHGDFSTSRQGLLRDGSSEAVCPTDDGQSF